MVALSVQSIGIVRGCRGFQLPRQRNHFAAYSWLRIGGLRETLRFKPQKELCWLSPFGDITCNSLFPSFHQTLFVRHLLRNCVVPLGVRLTTDPANTKGQGRRSALARSITCWGKPAHYLFNDKSPGHWASNVL